MVAPFHRDAGCGRKNARALRPDQPFSSPGKWSDLTYADRIEDVRAVVAAMPSSVLAAEVNMAELGVAGHSLGGYTALSLGGAWTLTRMPGVRAVLAMAPYAAPFLVHGTMSELAIPVMFQGGDLDARITTNLVRRGGAFDEASGPKYLVEFEGARHSSWGNKPNAAHDAMLAYAKAFLDRYVRGTGDSAVLSTKLAGVTAFRSDTR